MLGVDIVMGVTALIILGIGVLVAYDDWDDCSKESMEWDSITKTKETV